MVLILLERKKMSFGIADVQIVISNFSKLPLLYTKTKTHEQNFLDATTIFNLYSNVYQP